MNGAADLGGMMGFGAISHDNNEPHYHAKWQERSMTLTVAMGATGSWNIDQSRCARESLPPGEYLSSSYYRIWYRGLTRLMLARQMVTQEELLSGKMKAPPVKIKNKLLAQNVAATLAKGGPVDREPTSEPTFKRGDKIRAININPTGHTRLPRYVRGKTGTICRVHGFHVFPDKNALAEGECPAWLYQVQFTARELWGEEASPIDLVNVDMWEPYLEICT